MMKFHRPGRLRMLGGAAAIATLGGLSLAFGSAGAVAQPAPPAPPSSSAPRDDADRREERVIVRTYRHDEHRERHRDGARAERRGADGERREDRRVMVFTHRGDGHGERGTHPRIMEWGGRDGHMMVMSPEDCRDADRSEVNEGTPNNRTRVIVCSRGGERSAADRADALQRARARLADDDDIPAERRQRVLAAIDREIARLRGQ